MSHQITILVSKQSALDQKREINSLVRDGILSTVMFILPMLMVFILCLPVIMRVMGVTEDLVDIGYLFFALNIGSVFLISLSRVLLGTLRGLKIIQPSPLLR